MKKILSICLFGILPIALLSACGKSNGYIIDENESETYIEPTLESSSDDSLTSASFDDALTSASKNVASGDASKESATKIYVSVMGAVQNPGVYVLNEGARVFELINAAGGLSEDGDADGLNMVYIISDGMQIYIPKKAENETDDGENDGKPNAQIVTGLWADGKQGIQTVVGLPEIGKTNDNDLVNINSASKEILMTLPGVGESKAEAIIEYREKNGQYGQIEDIMKVTGIKEGMFAKIRDRICVK